MSCLEVSAQPDDFAVGVVGASYFLTAKIPDLLASVTYSLATNNIVECGL